MACYDNLPAKFWEVINTNSVDYYYSTLKVFFLVKISLNECNYDHSHKINSVNVYLGN